MCGESLDPSTEELPMTMTEAPTSDIGHREANRGRGGYMRGYPLERWHRDAKIFTLSEGTSEIQRLTIARAISGVRTR
jgi:alkylation response protein AidB-like acyl-CoA dehydrogenase